MINRRSKSSSNSARRDRGQANRNRHVFETLEPRMMLTGNLPGDLPIETDPVNSCSSAPEHPADASPNLNGAAGQRAIVGDYDLSGTVDRVDYLVWRNSFGSTVALAADGNQNGIIDLADYTLYADNLARSTAEEFAISGDRQATPATTDLDQDFIITLIDSSGTRHAANSQQSFTAAAPWILQKNPYLSDQRDNWIFDKQNGAYQNIQHTRINLPTNLIADNLSQNWKLEVTANSNHKTFAQLGIKKMALAGGDQSALLLPDNLDGGTWTTNQGKTTVTFNLNSKEISSYLNYRDGGNWSAVRQFTIQPYQEHSGVEYHGGRSIVVTIGPEGGYSRPGSWQTVRASQLNSVENLHKKCTFTDRNLQGNTYEIHVGSFADFLLGGGTTGSWNRMSPVHLEIDGTINTSEILLNQQIVYRDASWKPGIFKTVALDFDKKIFVSGSGLIDGSARLRETAQTTSGNLTPVDKFLNAILDLQSSYGKGNPTADWAIDVNGITVKYPPRRGQGTVALNGFTPSVSWWDGSGKTGDQLWMAQLGNAISASESFTYVTNPLGINANTRETGRVHAWDNQIIGGWVDASDGIETLAPYSEVSRNVFHVNDDAIKVLTSNQNFEQNLIHQGYIGSAISLSGYGYSSGPVANSNSWYGIYDTYVHRITQPATYPGTNVEGFGGLISNRTLFSRALSSNGNDDRVGGKGIFDVKISKIYVPSFAYNTTSEGTKEANSVYDVGVFSGLEWSPNGQTPPEDAYKAIMPTDIYGLHNLTVDNVHVYPISNTGKVWAPQYYFDTKNSGWQKVKRPITDFPNGDTIPITYNFYGQTKPVKVQIGYSQYTNSKISLSDHSLLITGSDDEDQLALPGFWQDRLGQVSDNKNKTVAPCENSPHGQIPAVLFVGQTGQDSYQVEPGAFTAILDHGTPADRDRLTGIPGRAGQWSHFRLSGNDYLLVSKHHPKTKVLLVDPLGRQEAGNRIAKLEFGSGESVRLKQFLNRSNSLGAMTYQQAARRIGLDVGKSLGLSSEDRLFLAGHTGVNANQIRFLVGRDHDQGQVGAPLANPPRPELPNRICGDAGPNILRGTAEVDHIFGGRSADNLYGGAHDDKLSGGPGSDILFGEAGDDFLSGGPDSDFLFGGLDNDWLLGDEGDDFLDGGTGSDYLSGGTGSDQLTGGVGKDVFLLSAELGRDVVHDFVLGDDTILLDSSVRQFRMKNLNGDAYLFSGEKEFAVVIGMGDKLTRIGSILS